MLTPDNTEFERAAFMVDDGAMVGDLLGFLAGHAEKPLVFFYEGRAVKPGYHVTEVKAADDRRAAETAKRLLEEADRRQENLLGSATRDMGREAATAWMDAANGFLRGLSPRVVARRSQSDYWQACGALEQWREERRREHERENRRLAALDKLRREARAALRRDDVAELWMRSVSRELDGGRPEKHCVDDKTLAECLEALSKAVKRR